MRKTDCPSLDEILSFPTERGERFFHELARRHGVTKDQLRTAAERIRLRTKITETNLILAGVENKRFVIYPLVDVF